MKARLKKFLNLINRHKIFTLVLIIVLFSGGYFSIKTFSKDSAETRYVLAAAEQGTLITSVSGSGQISAENQVDIKAKASGDVIKLNVKKGQSVKSGTILAQLDSSEAVKNVRDAEINLESANLAMEKLMASTSSYSLLQAENALISARNTLTKLKSSQANNYQQTLEDKEKAEDNLVKAYEDTYNSVANAFLDLPTIVADLHDVIYSTELSTSEVTGFPEQENRDLLINIADSEYRYDLKWVENIAENDYQTAKEKYNANFDNYTKSTRYSDQETIEALLTETLDTVKAVAQAAKSESNLLDSWVEFQSRKNRPVLSLIRDYQNELSSNLSQANNQLSNLLADERSLENNKEAVIDTEIIIKELEQNNPLDLAVAEASLAEKIASLENLKSGADSLEIRGQEIAIRQRQYALADAQEKLSNYTIRAPFDGIIAEVSIAKADSLSSGATVATLITKQQIAEITLNEVDVAKVNVDQKATLTFDAVEDLSISGEVAEVDLIGTANQGVVSYTVKIAFDTQDERIKPGMSVTASIITELKQDVVLVPNSAIKSSGEINYIEILKIAAADQALATSNAGITSAEVPEQIQVEIGLANDSQTEIISGLNSGDMVVTRTIASSNTTTTASTQTSGQSIFQTSGNSSRPNGGFMPGI